MNKQKIKYPIGIQSFSEIRNGGYIYVDKTEFVYRLANEGKYYFLARPRRFGKSLLLSTLKAYFEGRNDLFEGLAISQLEHKWHRYPVMLLSLARYNPSEQDLSAILSNYLSELETEYGCLLETDNFSMRFANVIKAAYRKTGSKVVILIDEYDAPVVAHLEQPDKQDKSRDLLKSVYSNLKDMDEYIQFALLTGVSRFSKMTIFSGLNNLNDISLDSTYSEICGITQEELEGYFDNGISNLADKMKVDYEEALECLKANYDGYHFTEDSADLYNPFSLLNALSKGKIGAFWFKSGTPTFLIERLKKVNEPLSYLLNESIGESVISDIDADTSNPLALLFQTGYLTIKDYDFRRGLYTLGIPNKEVEKGLFTELLAFNTVIDKYKVDERMWGIRDAFETGKPELALDLMKSFFAGVPANVTMNKSELYFENNLYMLLHLVGIDARTEFWTSDGRIDMVVEMSDFVYVMELKLDGTAKKALEQIEAKEYDMQWKHSNKRIFRIGINFSSHTRNIDSWIIKG